MNPLVGFLTMSSIVIGTGAPALDDAALRAILQQRLDGDRTGACFVAAVIDDGVARARVCVDPKREDDLDASTAFEIGSVSKTMTATLAAGLIAEGKLSLDDPLAEHVPAGTTVPEFDGKPILIRHLLTHTSGLPALPARMQPARGDDPYAALTDAQLYGSLADVTLTAAPGTRFAYSNYAMMLMSDIVARRAGKDFDAVIAERLFAPLAMKHSYVGKPPRGTRSAQGHLQTGVPAHAWNFPANYAGVGGVRASLDDMVRYVEAELGKRRTPLDADIAMTQRRLAQVQGTRVGMNWLFSGPEDAPVLGHEGGTGGFSSLVLFDRAKGRGVVILSDTSLNALGGLGRLGMHLLEGSVPLEAPRRKARPDAKLLDALVGEYRLDGGLAMKLTRDGDALVIQASGQPAFEMGYDSAGDFYPLAFDAVLHPQPAADGSHTFVWRQGGGSMRATRVQNAPANAPLALSAAKLAEYAGRYPLAPTFALSVFEKDGKLYVQGSGQGAIEVTAVDTDVFSAEIVQARLVFERDAAGRVSAVVLHQGGAAQRGVRE